MSNLSSLLEKVRKVEGIDEPSLGIAICAELIPGRYLPVERSLDACLSLLREKFPDWWWRVGSHEFFGAQIGPVITKGTREFRSDDGMPAPLALLDCILQALLSQQSEVEKT